MTNRLLQEIEKYKENRDMNKALENRWVSKYLQLLDFKNKHGHTDVPARYETSMTLAYWVRRQRLVYHEGKLDPMREHLLKEVNFSFRLMEIHNWDSMYQKLLDYKMQYGHVRITENHHDIKLYNWLTYQRKLSWKGKLAPQKLKQLKRLGVHMDNKATNRWDEKFAKLGKFKEDNGHLYVCNYFSADKQLINFVKVIRRSKEKLTERQKKMLEDIGFNWNPGKELTILINKERANKMWLSRYKELKAYREKFGTCHILTTSKDYLSLANWISVQRNSINNLSSERIKLLSAINFFEENNLKKRK